ncbi:MAG: putative repeat protein (TIGR01451 family), partial [Mariniblastus sp.]
TVAPDPSACSSAQKTTAPNNGFPNTNFDGLRNSATSRSNEPASQSGFTPPMVDAGLAAQTANPAEKRTFPNDLRAKTPPNNANATIAAPLNQPFGRPLAPANTAANPNANRSQTTAIQSKASPGFGARNASGPGANQQSFNNRPGTQFGSLQNNTQQDAARQTASPELRSTFAETPNKSILTQRATTAPALKNSPINQFGSVGGSGQSGLSGRQTTPPANSNLQATDKPGARNLDGVQAPALTVEKRSPREIQVQQTAEFELIIKNVGRVAAEDVQVFDHVPAGTEFKGAVPEPTRLSQNRDIQWNIGQLLPGQEKRIKLKLQPMVPGEIGSVAHVTFATRASMRTLVTKPELEIVHQTKPMHLIGDSVVLDVVVKNKGDGPAKNVMIQQDVPKQLDFPDGLPGGNRGIEYEVGTLLPGKSRRIRLNLKAANVGKIRNVMYASADGGLRAQHELPMEIVSPKLVARTEGPKIRFLNRNVTHTLSVANQGTASATNVELVAKLPTGLKFLEANNQGLYDRNTHSVHWNVSELARGVEAKVELKTAPIAVGSQPIKFETFGDLSMKAQTEHPLSVEHLVDVFFDIDDVADPIEIGAETTYQIRVVNQGTKAATNVKLNVDFPNGLAPTSVEGALRHNIRGQQIIFEPINSMSPGDEIKIIIHSKGQAVGDHRVVANMQTDGRSAQVSKQETTRVYSDR